MNKILLSLFVLLIFTLLSTQCKTDDGTSGFESDQAELIRLKTEIELLASTSVYNESVECKYIGLGSKPCGGPWAYLIYSTSIDTEKLENLVENYNEKERSFNSKWGLVSDCAFVNPPSNIKCENNTCIAEY
ncbi:hypothetical protein VOI54_05145 [Tamlana sp. 2201CG12-4]|uniref:hypothetical protein n=1 Tax=Tamlana sp. 2201CG12-4 TaxID=3112582 RepID=UPI002DB64D37|nr:hypothetical protein [Tamlana sp. 2201CG12-4]MEC3906393.1 hypothetical protein [Tamlana sp. 2201CG12-4]